MWGLTTERKLVSNWSNLWGFFSTLHWISLVFLLKGHTILVCGRTISLGTLLSSSYPTRIGRWSWPMPRTVVPLQSILTLISPPTYPGCERTWEMSYGQMRAKGKPAHLSYGRIWIRRTGATAGPTNSMDGNGSGCGTNQVGWGINGGHRGTLSGGARVGGQQPPKSGTLGVVQGRNTLYSEVAATSPPSIPSGPASMAPPQESPSLSLPNDVTNGNTSVKTVLAVLSDCPCHLSC